VDFTRGAKSSNRKLDRGVIVVSLQDTQDRVKDIIADQLGISIEDVRVDSVFSSDLGADDLDFMELVMAFEEEFEVEIGEDDAENLDTVQNVIDFILRRAN